MFAITTTTTTIYSKKKSRPPIIWLQNFVVASSLFVVAAQLLIYNTVTVCQALKVSANIPELVKLNDAFWLNCTHQQQQSAKTLRSSNQPDDQPSSSSSSSSINGKEWDDIYSIKWYKDDEEFYRFLPNGQPKVSIYETNGIQLDQTKSHEGNVYINKADVNSEGNYRCEIVSEAPVFETVRKSKNLKVYALPIRGPRIEILDSQGRPKSPKAQEISYAVGDKIELRCNSAPSKPASKLRWYLNDHEITIPTTNSTTATATAHFPLQSFGSGGGGLTTADSSSKGTTNNKAGSSHYEVKVTPIEFRQHYKSIYSSHSTLSLVLQQDDLINNKISFKCLASMRQEVPLRSKQLIVLMAPLASSSSSLSSSSSSSASSQLRRTISTRDRRQQNNDEMQLLQATDSAAAAAAGSFNQQQQQRQRPQNQRHSVTRLHQLGQQQQQNPKQLINSNLLSLNDNQLQQQQLRSSNQQQQQQQMLYIYEEANSALGSTRIDTFDGLESYLSAKQQQQTSELSMLTTKSKNSETNYALDDINRASDNLEYIQLLRERSNSIGARHRAAGGTQTANTKQRLFGTNSVLVKSPFYLDENDPLRPIISWPPLESGKLLLSGTSLVASPDVGSGGSSTSTSDTGVGEHQLSRFLLASKSVNNQQQFLLEDMNRGRDEQQDDLGPAAVRRTQLEKLLKNINCTCTDGSVDTRLSWLINDYQLDPKDTRFYPTRVGLDHRQTIFTIGLSNFQTNTPATATIFDSPSLNSRSSPLSSSVVINSSPQRTLKSLLAGYMINSSSRSQNSPSLSSSSSAAAASVSSSTGTTNSNDQIRFSCQAIYSILLHSSSEMITFDFNPPPPLNTLDSDTNSIAVDKFSASSSNVIQATTASQSSSASSRNPIGSQHIIGSQMITFLFIALLYLVHRAHQYDGM